MINLINNIEGIHGMVPIKTMIVDDHEASLAILEYLTRDFPDFEIIGTCTNGEELIEEVMLKKPDLVLADINMPKVNGIQAMRECLLFCPGLKFIFITGCSDYAVEAFRLAAIDYIVKPFEKMRLYKALEKARNLFYFEREKFNIQPRIDKMKNLPLREQNSTRYIPLTDIYFIEKVGKKCLVYTKDIIYDTNETIGKILARLDDSFFPAHRSFIINLSKISHITPQNETYIVYFKDFQKQASISKLKINEVREKISKLSN